MNKHISVKTGIYETEYTLITHRDGSISVKIPYIHWVRDSGMLRHRVQNVHPDDQADVIAFFEQETLVLPANNNGGALTLDDILNGERHPGVHVIVD